MKPCLSLSLSLCIYLFSGVYVNGLVIDSFLLNVLFFFIGICHTTISVDQCPGFLLELSSMFARFVCFLLLVSLIISCFSLLVIGFLLCFIISIVGNPLICGSKDVDGCSGTAIPVALSFSMGSSPGKIY